MGRHTKPRTKKTSRTVGMPTQGMKARLNEKYGKGTTAPPPVDAPASTEPRGAGRPRATINRRMLAGLAAIQCTYDEIAAVLGVDVTTISKNDDYSKVVEQEREAGKMSIRRAQFTSGLNGNVTMLIWLGKQYLGQKDKLENSAPPGELPLLVMRVMQPSEMPQSAGTTLALDSDAPLVPS